MPSVARVLHQGLAADKPVADAAANQGWLYYETDTGVLQQSWNGAWVAINTPDLTNVWVKLAQVDVGMGGAADIAFTSIPSSDGLGAYRSLKVMGQGRSDNSNPWRYLRLELNADGAANYHWAFLNASDRAFFESSSSDTAISAGYIAAATAPSGCAGIWEIDIPHFAGTVFRKQIIGNNYMQQGDSATSDNNCQAVGGEWKSTAAITEVRLFPNLGNWIEGSFAALYAMR